MQPIVFDYKNSQNQSSPSFGIVPNQEINEIQFLEDLFPFGDPNEPLLSTAISMIATPKNAPLLIPNFHSVLFKTSQNLERFGTEMYLDKGFNINR